MMKYAPRHSGNTLTEYGLILGLISVGCIGAISVLGGSLSEGLHTLLPTGSPASAQVTAPASSPAPSEEAAGDTDVPSPSSNPGAANANNPFLPYMTDFSDVKGELAGSIETLGANGTTNMLASTLNDIIDQLLADPSLSPEQKSALADLSNQGHELARRQQYAATLFQQNATNPEALLYRPLEFEGQQYQTFREFSYSMGDNNPNKVMGESLSKMYSLLDKARASGALDNPQNNLTVSQLVGGIAAVSDAYAQGLLDTGDLDKSNIDNLSKRTNHLLDEWGKDYWNLAGVDKISVANQTHQNSGKICTVGGGSDSGTACQ